VVFLKTAVNNLSAPKRQRTTKKGPVKLEKQLDIFYLDVRKTVQAIGVLLGARAARQLEYIAIIKLLYIADRESWKETGASITGDVPCAMKNGPVLSGVFDLVNLNDRLGLETWIRYIHKEDYDIMLKEAPGDDLLSDYEVKKLTEVSKRHRNHDWRKLIDITHKLPEWMANNPENRGLKMLPIPLDDILEAVGRSEDIKIIKKDAEAAVAMHRVFGR
jgi:uncharacterized phage-associated protein